MKKIVLIICVLFALSAKADPIVRGTWFGYVLTNGIKLPTTIYITDDNDEGDIYGEITMTYNYQSGKSYYCKALVSGYIDYETYDFNLVMEEFVYYDLLPEGMKWCLGTLYCGIRREMELKEFVILGSLRTNCAETDSDVILVKQQ